MSVATTTPQSLNLQLSLIQTQGRLATKTLAEVLPHELRWCLRPNGRPPAAFMKADEGVVGFRDFPGKSKISPSFPTLSLLDQCQPSGKDPQLKVQPQLSK